MIKLLYKPFSILVNTTSPTLVVALMGWRPFIQAVGK
jgi:hypothetical protein